MSLQFYILGRSVNDKFEYSFTYVSCSALNLMFIYKIIVYLCHDNYIKVKMYVLLSLEFIHITYKIIVCVYNDHYVKFK